jgi:hypothetical protein
MTMFAISTPKGEKISIKHPIYQKEIEFLII